MQSLSFFVLLVIAISGTNGYVSDDDKLLIKKLHNLVRKNTDPEAADMQYMASEK